MWGYGRGQIRCRPNNKPPVFSHGSNCENKGILLMQPSSYGIDVAIRVCPGPQV